MIRATDPSKGEQSVFPTFLPGIDMGFKDKDGQDIGPEAGLSWVRPVPWGFGKLISWAYEK